MAYPARGPDGPPVEGMPGSRQPNKVAADRGLMAEELEDDYLLLALLATGLAQIRENPPHLRAASDGERRAHLPLSAAWQWGMTRLWWRCFLSGVQPPASDLEVFQWCRRPLAEWPVQLRVGEGDRWTALIEEDSPSDFAEQAVRVRTGDVEAHLVEERVFRELMLTAQANATAERSAQSLYERLRLLLIEQPILSDLQANQLLHLYPARGADEEPYFKSLLLAACERRESAGVVELDVCGGCGNLIGASPGGPEPQCGTPGCRPSRQGLQLTTIGA